MFFLIAALLLTYELVNYYLFVIPHSAAYNRRDGIVAGSKTSRCRVPIFFIGLRTLVSIRWYGRALIIIFYICAGY